MFVVIPAFNEAQVIRNTIRPLLECGYRVVVVDDCSTDSTWSELNGLPVIRLRHPINLGQGAALETGMEFCRRSGAGYVIHFDADGQHDWREIPSLLEPLRQGQADVVFGSRFLEAEHIRSIPLSKRLILRLGILVSGVSSGVWLTDTHNGFRALSAAAVARIRLSENGFAHATEILERVRKNRLRYVERPTHVRYTDYSKAKGQSPWNAINLLVDLIVRRVFP